MEKIIKQLRQDARKLTEAADLLEGFTASKPKPKHRRLSKAARHKISLAQKARWKVYHGGKKAA